MTNTEPAPDAGSRFSFAALAKWASKAMALCFGARPATEGGPSAPATLATAPAGETPKPLMEDAMTTKTSTNTKASKPLTQRAWEMLMKRGAASTDTLARRLGATSRATSKALSGLKRRGLASFRVAAESGENVWTAKGKTWPG